MELDKKDITIKTGERIRHFRTLKRLSQEDLALAADINPAYIGHIERGLKCPTIATLSKICKALEISLSELLDFEPKENTAESESMQRIRLDLKKLNDFELESVANIISEIINIKASKDKNE